MNKMKEKITTERQVTNSLTKFKYLGKTPTNKNCIYEESDNRLNSGYAWKHSVPNGPEYFTNPFAVKNVRIKIYRI
jgi:hypothetical protein